MNKELIRCKPSDLETLKEISFQTFYETFEDVTAKKSIDDYTNSAYTNKNLIEELNDSNSFFYFLYLDKKLAGYLKLNINNSQTEPMGSEYLEIQRIYIKNDFQKNGLGKILINKSIEIAKKYNKKYIWLGVWEYNYIAQKFYKKHGFTKTGSHVFMMGDEKQTDYIMKKQLDI